MPKLTDIINASEVKLYVDNLPTEVTIDSALFPNKKQVGMELKSARGARQRPVALKMSTFDVAVKPRALRAELSIEKKLMPFFKESVLINEEDRQTLLLALQANNQNLIEHLTEQIYENYSVLVDGAEIQA